MLHIRNLPANRQWFVKTRRIGLVEHLRWWWSSRRRRAEHVYIVEHQASHAGYVRIQFVGSGTAKVSIALDPSFQGMGIGRAALCAALKKAGAQ